MEQTPYQILYDPQAAVANRFWFGGQCSADFGIIVSGVNTYNAPERDVEKISVPGRDGDMILDNNRLKNITIQYPISFARDFPNHAAAAKAWLLSSGGYKRLTDSYNPEYFRKAAFTGPIDFDTSFLNRVGEATLSFDCKPQFYLVSGEMPMQLSKATVLHNPGFPSLPTIHIYGSAPGELTVGDTTVSILALNGDLTLDSENMDAYRVGDGVLVNCNGMIYAPEFPVLQPGENKISWSGGIDHIEIIPRWWTL